MKKVKSFNEFINESNHLDPNMMQKHLLYFYGDMTTAKTTFKNNKDAVVNNIATYLDLDKKEVAKAITNTLKLVKESEEINEAASWGVDVEDPFSDRDEQKAMNSFKYVPKVATVTVVGASGTISDDIMDINVQFSNGDQIDYFNHSAPNSRTPSELTISKSDSNQAGIPIPDFLMDRYFGSTGTVVGDLCLIYRDFLEGKIK